MKLACKECGATGIKLFRIFFSETLHCHYCKMKSTHGKEYIPAIHQSTIKPYAGDAAFVSDITTVPQEDLTSWENLPLVPFPLPSEVL